MVYKRYIKKGGKTFGPYYYESYRDGGKVKTRYVENISGSKNGETGKSFGSPGVNKKLVFTSVLLFCLIVVFFGRLCFHV